VAAKTRRLRLNRPGSQPVSVIRSVGWREGFGRVGRASAVALWVDPKVHTAGVARFRSKIVAGPGADYGSFQSIADVLRQIGHDERVHKHGPLEAIKQPRFR